MRERRRERGHPPAPRAPGRSRWRSRSGRGWPPPTRRSTSTSIRVGSSRTWPRCGPRPASSATSRPASRPATCSRWDRSSPSGTRSGCPTGSSSGCGWERCWRSRPGAWSGCSTRCGAAPRGIAQLIAGAVMRAQPVCRHLRQPHDGHAAGLRRAAVAAARRPPRAARARADGAGRRPWRCWSPPPAAGSTAPSPPGCSLGPVLLLVYEVLFAEVGWPAARAFLIRARGADRARVAVVGRSRPTCSPPTGSTSCSSPSSRERSGARRARPRACG